MATKLFCVLCLTVLLCEPFLSAVAVRVGGRRAKKSSTFSGTVHFNNPSLLNEQMKGSDGGYSHSDTRHNPMDHKSMMLGGIYIQSEANRLASKLRRLTNDELGVPALQGVFDSLTYTKAKTQSDHLVKQLAEDLKQKFDKYVKMLHINKMTVEQMYKFHPRRPITNRHECCNLHSTQLSFDRAYGCAISKKYSCDLIPPSVPKGSFNPGRNLTEVFQQTLQFVPSIKWQYFISVDGIHNEYPAHNFHTLFSEECRNAHDTRHRDVYVATVHPPRKHVVLMVDHGNSLSANQLKTAKAVAKHIISSLTDHDRVGVIGLSSQVSYARRDNCVNCTLIPLTHEAKLHFSTFIDNLHKKELVVNHSLGFMKAFDMIRNYSTTVTLPPEEAMIIYISRGLMSSLTDSRDVLEAIKAQNKKLKQKVVINTFAVIEDGKPIMYEKSFMQNIAEQNLYYDNATDDQAKAGIMRAVNSTKDLSSVVGDFFKPLNNNIADEPKIFFPHYDDACAGLVMSMSWPCFHEGQLLGMVGFDVHLAHVVDKLTYFSKEKGTYAFLMDTAGITIMHPSLDRPIMARDSSMPTDISHFETDQGFSKIREKILSAPSGFEELTLVKPREYGVPQSGDMPDVRKIKFYWTKVEKMEFIVVIKTVKDSTVYRDLKDITVQRPPRLQYHRLDLLPSDHTCMHLKQLATFDMASLFLSAHSFQKPFNYLIQTETKRQVNVYLAYLKDNTNLLTNSGIKEGVRNDVAALSRIDHDWSERYRHSRMNQFIVRKYTATPRGVFKMFPGTLIDKKYDPSKRAWYTRAVDYPGRVTLTAPYLDIGGAGYIVTVSHTIYEGKQDASHSFSDQVAAVMGIDMTLGYFYRVLVETLPVCEEKNIRCFIMDDRGYLVAHRGLIEPNGKGPVEQEHITHKEPQVANDILNHQGFVRKKLCNSYSDRTIQRFYQFNTSFDGVLTNLLHGDHCHKYQITTIPGTNTFLGVVNVTCTMMMAFCPCSMVDRLCLNCHRMEQTECECPCECPLEMDFCSNKLLQDEDKNPSCKRYPEKVDRAPLSQQVQKRLPQCFRSPCEEHRTKTACMGVVDCEWCQLDRDGRTPLHTPFCATQRVCFAGVLGEETPYADQIAAPRLQEKPVTIKSTPVGPVAGGIMGCFLVLALAVYCYRHHVHRQANQYITAVPDNPYRMSHIENEGDDMEPGDDLGTGHTNIMLATFENPASISPYRVNTTYRRPTGGESDHGYSTMTPHDDSEQASTACAEPLLIGRDRYRPPAAQTVIKGTPMIPPPPSSRRSRSPTPPQTRILPYATIPEQTSLCPESTEVPGQTVISAVPESSPHSILANVQVHMVDSH